jgi:hypothetical protein
LFDDLDDQYVDFDMHAAQVPYICVHLDEFAST